MSDVEMSAREKMRCLMSGLEAEGLTEYGSFIPNEFVWGMLEIEMPEVASRDVYNKISLLELAAIDYCRNVLLGQGKYLTSTKNGYRILLPSENAGQISSYMASADRKLVRALKLHRNTPKSDVNHPSQDEARLLMKRDGIRSIIPEGEITEGNIQMPTSMRPSVIFN